MFGRSLAQVLGSNFGFIAGRVLSNSGAVSLASMSQSQLFTGTPSVIRIAAGRYQISITDFRGPSGIVIPWVTAGSSASAGLGTGLEPALSTSITLNSFNGTNTDLYSFVINIASGNTLTDADAYFSAFSF